MMKKRIGNVAASVRRRLGGGGGERVAGEYGVVPPVSLHADSQRGDQH